MVIASSKNETCIERLHHLLEQRYPDTKFEYENGHTSRIVVPDCPQNIDEQLYAELSLFCDGYTSGWEAGEEHGWDAYKYTSGD